MTVKIRSALVIVIVIELVLDGFTKQSTCRPIEQLCPMASRITTSRDVHEATDCSKVARMGGARVPRTLSHAVTAAIFGSAADEIVTA